MRPSDCRSASVKAVDLFREGSWISSGPRFAMVVIGVALRRYFVRLGGQWSSSCAACNVRPDHLCRIDNAIKLLLVYKPKFQRRGLQCEVVVHRMMGNLGRLVVTDHRR